ncbi:MAG TPA: hypothetical protein VH880_13435, partial [Anaeromyxobacteraceae bacterium]
SRSTPAGPFMRDMSDPAASRTCQGDGTLVSHFGASGINGLDGEVHDDGEIWNGFFWEVYQGLETGGVKGCGGACAAGPALQYKTMQLAGGTSPTLNSYWVTMKAAASALFPGQPAVATYVDCVAKRRKLDRCDRTVPVFAGETKVEFVRLRWAPFQMVIDVTGAGGSSFDVCSGNGTATTVYGRVGAPVQLSAIDPATLDATVTADGSVPFAQACSGGTPTTITLSGPATWYLLFDSPSALVGGSPGFDIYKVVVSGTGAAARPAGTAPPTCTPPSGGGSIAISPPAPSVAPKGSVSFTASGGTGALTWSLQTNASGGSIVAATGAYTAGATGGVTDVVKVVDAALATATASVTVTAGVSIFPPSATVAPLGTRSFTASGGSGTGYTWSLSTNASGGSIVAGTGAYTAGSTGNVADVVRVVDSLGNQATATVTVTAAAGLAISPPAATVPPKGTQAFTASGASGALTWSLLANASGGSINASTGAYTAGATGGVVDVVKVVDAALATATANVTVTAGVSISPAAPTVAPKGTQAFTASGGSGTGYTWSLSTNASGGSIVAATGAYTAGLTGSVTDVVQVVDSLGNTAAASVTVSAGGGGGGGGGSTDSKKGCGCASGGDAAWALGLALAGLLRLRAGMRRRA